MREGQGFDGQGGEGRPPPGGGARKGALSERARGAIRRGRSRLQRYPRLLRMLVTAWRLGAQLWRKLVDDDCLSRAASLSYTTILAVVPLMAVSFLVFRMSGAFDGVEAEVRHWMLESLLAESVGSVREVLDVFLGRVSSGAVGVTGAVMLVFTATWLFVSAEGTLNHIWRVAKPRSLFARFTTFWAILTLGPLCLGVGFYLSAQLGQTALGRRFESLPWLGRTLQLGLPYLLSVTALALVYKLVPATRVRWRAALVGGLLAGVLFELSKVGFNFYVTQIYQGSTSTRIYGAFALFPVFLLWIYILWLVVLLGAVVAYTVQHFSLLYDDELRERAPGPESSGAALSPFLACRLMLLIAYRHQQGARPLIKEAMAQAVRADERTVYQALVRLERGGLVVPLDRSGEQVWLPSRDIGEITLDDVLEAFDAAGIAPDSREPPLEARALVDLFCDLRLRQREVAGEITFRDLAQTVRPSDHASLFLLEPRSSGLSEDEAKRPPSSDLPKAPKKPILTAGGREEEEE